MNVTKEQLTDLNTIVNIQIEPADYNPAVEGSLKKMRKQVAMKGFRKGMVPASLVKKMYGNQILAEELDKLIQDSLNNYIKENELEVLGQPIPHDNKQPEIDINDPKTFEFSYEIGLAPEFTIDFLNKKTKVTGYKIEVDDATVNTELERIKKQGGETINPEEGPLEENDVIVVDLKELDGKKEKEGGVQNLGLALALDMATDKAKKALLKLEFGGTTTVNPFDLLKDKTKEEAAKHLLNLSADELEGVGEKFSLTVTKINRVQPSELNQELFDKVFGKDAVKSEEEFMAKLKEEIEKAFVGQADQRLGFDIVSQMLEATKIELPEDFLKRWIKLTNEKPITDEQLENEFDAFARNLRWNLTVNKISKDNDIKVEADEIKAHTKQQILAQFGNFGGEFPEDQLDQWADSMLGNQEHVQRTYEQLLDQKLIDYIKGQITVTEKKISLDDFQNLDQKES